LIGFALAHAEQAALPHLERRGFEGGQDEEQAIFRCWEWTVLVHGKPAGGPRFPIEAPRRHMRVQRRLKGRDQLRKLGEGQAGAIQEPRGAGLQVSEPYTSHGSCLLSLYRDIRGASYQKESGINSIEQYESEQDSEQLTMVLGRITPLTSTKNDLLLETERRKGSWFEVAEGSAAKLIKIIASESKGTLHGLGFLDASLRRLGEGQARLPVMLNDQRQFVYADTGEGCTAQEALFHYFGLPVAVVAEPSGWYSYHRTPRIIEASEDRTRVLVRFTAESMSGESFGGTCLYVCQDGQWGAYTIRPSESQTLAQAEAWLVKRQWRAWS